MDEQGTGRDELGKPRARLADVDAELVGLIARRAALAGRVAEAPDPLPGRRT
jgi:chorismate mutase